MPDVKRYKNKKHFMQDCMHINKGEGLNTDQSLGKDGIVHKTKEEAEADKEDHFDGETSEK